MYSYNYSEREPHYLELLTGFGLKVQEAKIYLACLKLGQSTVSQIAKEAGIQRTFVYDILDNLKKRGLISSIDLAGKKRFQAVSIESLKSLLKEKFDRFEAFIPELKSLEKLPGKANVRFFEGKEGSIAAIKDALNQPPGSEILCISNAEGAYLNEKEMDQWYIDERVKRGITMRFIAPDNPATMQFVKKDKKHKRVTRVVPNELFPFEADINIYGNEQSSSPHKVAIASLNEKEIVGMIIESESIAKTMKMIFELAWKGASLPHK